MQEKEIIKKLNKIRSYVVAENQDKALELIDNLKDELYSQKDNTKEYIDKLVKELK